MAIKPINRMAQVMHRSVGSPASALPDTAISNCFPGLEFDFKGFWRRAFVGIVLQEWDNYVVDVEQPEHENLRFHRLLQVDGRGVLTRVTGPVIPGGGDDGLSLPPGGDVVTMEWSNSLAFVMQRQGAVVDCLFTSKRSDDPVALPFNLKETVLVRLEVRRLLEDSGAPSLGALKPGELTQGLCSPWQHDYRECACYYWPATRPDYVNVEPGPNGVSRGDNWMAKNRTGSYVLDDRVDSRLLSYEDLFSSWEAMLRFQIRGRDSEEG
jgi:hypothetical protein